MTDVYTEAVHLTHEQLTYLRNMMAEEKGDFSLKLFTLFDYHARNPLWKNVVDGEAIYPNHKPFKVM